MLALPFAADALVSIGTLKETSHETTEEDGCEYVKMTDGEERSFIDASERLLPQSLRDNPVTGYMLTRNWKDDASEVSENPLVK